MPLTVLKFPVSNFAGYGESHQGGFSVCVSAHAEWIAADREFQMGLSRLAQTTVPPIAEFLLEHVAEEVAKRLVGDIDAALRPDLLMTILRHMLAYSNARFCIDIIGTDDLLARKLSGLRNKSGLNTVDPSHQKFY